MPTAAVQKQIDDAVAQAVAAAQAQVVTAVSKPQHIDDLRKTWRKSAEHKAAQIKRFLYAMGGVIIAQITPEIIAGKNPLTHFTDAKTAWYFLLPFAFVAWKQVHPSMSASEVDSAPGATIVPSQVVEGGQDVTPPTPVGVQPDALGAGAAGGAQQQGDAAP